MILCMISDRLQKHGRLDIFLEWGMNHGDYQFLSDGLPSIGKAHILPPNPNGLSGNLHGSRQCDAPLALGLLYRAIFPETARLPIGGVPLMSTQRC